MGVALYECIDVPSTRVSKMRALFSHLVSPIPHDVRAIRGILFRTATPADPRPPSFRCCLALASEWEKRDCSH